MSIFKACDVRGKYPHEIDENIVYNIGRAIGTILGSGKIVVGGDVRLSTPALKQSLVRGIMETGCDVIDIGIVPTPVFYFAKSSLMADAGVMVTASHNPPEYNGLKITLGKIPITGEQIMHIKATSESRNFTKGDGKLTDYDITPEYLAHIQSIGQNILGETHRLPNVVLDCGNGCFSKIAPKVLSALSTPYTPLFCEPDGSFPNRSPNSAVAANLTELCAVVRQNNADLGIAFDGDGDRVSFTDENGSMLSADQSIAIIARYMGGGIGSGNKAVLDIKCSSAVSDVIKSLGAIPIIEKSGHTFIKTRMIKEDAIIGGEVSGHFFYKDIGGGDDGLYSALIMIGIVATYGPLSKLVTDIPSYVTTPDIRLHVPPDPALLDRIAEAFPPERVSRLDGVRVQFENGWGLARLSVTEPIITLRFEAIDRSALDNIISEFLDPAPILKKAMSESHY